MSKPTIGLLISVCSRNQNYVTLGHSDIFRWLLPSFFNTYEPNKFNYKFFIGFDDDDEFFLKNLELIKKRLSNKPTRAGQHSTNIVEGMCTITILKGCQKNPCKAWNILLKENIDKADYFYQIGSDINLLSRDWSSYFVSQLKKNNNIGITGGVDKSFWFARILQNQNGIIENGFFHKTHYEIFKTLFNERFKTWFSDDYITRIYMLNNCCYLSPNILFKNMNRVGQIAYKDRYNPDLEIKDKWLNIANEDAKKIFNFKNNFK